MGWALDPDLYAYAELPARRTAGVEDLRLSVPEIGLQAALNLEMIQLQLDVQNVFGEIRRALLAPTCSPVTPSPLLCVLTTIVTCFSTEDIRSV